MLFKALFTMAIFLLGAHKVGTAQAQSPVAPDEAASRLVRDAEDLIASLAIETEDFSVRINRCQGKFGEFADDVYSVWIGWRGFDRTETAGARLAAIRFHWSENGWDITRGRLLDNGGINLAAIEPLTGNLYSLDSDFEEGPENYIVGYFNTPCFLDPAGDTAFGCWSGS